MSEDLSPIEGDIVAGQDHHADSSRDEKGRFIKGNPYWQGQPRLVAQIRTTIRNCISTDELSEIMRGLLTDPNGFVKLGALRLWLEYSVGKPKETISIEQQRHPVDLSTLSATEQQQLIALAEKALTQEPPQAL